MSEISCVSTSLSAFGVVSVLDFSHSNRCVVVSHRFNLQFPDDIGCGESFICLFAICKSSLVRCLLRSLAHLLNWVVCFLNVNSSLYILDISPLSDVSSADIFSPCLWLVFLFS